MLGAVYTPGLYNAWCMVYMVYILHDYSIHETELKVLKDYLSNKKQFVQIRKKTVLGTYKQESLKDRILDLSFSLSYNLC